MGCKGPTTYNACTTTRWNEGESFPIGSGHGCIGCSEDVFWDKGSFYNRLTDIHQFGIEANADQVGGTAAGVVGVMVAVLSLVASGCKGNSDLQTEVIAPKTMQCGMCEDNVEKAVYGGEGVKSVEVDLKGKTVTVKFLPAQTNLPTIERAITDAGYDANDRKRDPGAYEKLDACCKTD